jgi:hypothetical protein
MVSGMIFRAPPAVLTDVPVLVLLMLSWMTVPVFWAHVATGLTLVGLIGIHLSTRRRSPLRTGAVLRRLAYVAFLVVATAMAATGLMRLGGLPPQHTWHGGISYLAMGLAAVHLWSVRHALRARIRLRKPTKGARREH